MTDFEAKVYEAVRRIPEGKVASYGQIAAWAGVPGAARAVGNALHRNPDGDYTPCFRVVHADGRLSAAYGFGGIYAQKERLLEDGVEVWNGRVNMAEYQCTDDELYKTAFSVNMAGAASPTFNMAGDAGSCHALMDSLRNAEEVFWPNPGKLPYEEAAAACPFGMEEIRDAEARLLRFAPYFREVFPETKKTDGIIESELRAIPCMEAALQPPCEERAALQSPCEKGTATSTLREQESSTPHEQAALTQHDRASEMPDHAGNLYIKLDSALPISGSIKARGGIYEVLKTAEEIALAEGLLRPGMNYACFTRKEFHDLFSRYSIAVGSTGNLGLSIGIMSARLGFRTFVHMSHDARQWKKDMLRSYGVTVVEYEEDYSVAVKKGREAAKDDPYCHFVDDENSKNLFFGYAVAALRLKEQLREAHIPVDEAHPLYVYLPCGVGGGPGGVSFGLKTVFGDHAHCFFVEPTQCPSMLLGMATGLHHGISIADIGLRNLTCADGLACGRPSGFVGKTMEPFMDGCITVSDEHMFTYLKTIWDTEKIKLEPSACAGFRGAELFMNNVPGATHLVWATGGGMVPETEWRTYYER